MEQTLLPDRVQVRDETNKKGTAKLPGRECIGNPEKLVNSFLISLFNKFSGMAEGDHPEQLVVAQNDRPAVPYCVLGKTSGCSQGIELENGFSGLCKHFSRPPLVANTIYHSERVKS